MRVATQRIAAPTATMFAVIASAVVALVPALIWHGAEMIEQSLDAYALVCPSWDSWDTPWPSPS